MPGGLGLTTWLTQTHAGISPQASLLGGPNGIPHAFSALFPEGADIAISQESSDYRPEMEWLCQQLGSHFAVRSAETAALGRKPIYRFFELFDHANLPNFSGLLKKLEQHGQHIDAPLKPWLEEKLWLALLWNPSLRPYWRRSLRDSHFQRLLKLVPQSWVLDPTPLPPHAVIPGLEVQDWRELAHFSQKQRRLVAKLSGFSENAWGSKSVTVGHDVSRDTWSSTLENHLANFSQSPAILQRFIPTGIIQHPYFDPKSGGIRVMDGRVRLCPYYFRLPESKIPKLAGVLATIVPADKKIIHGMEDAILVPCQTV